MLFRKTILSALLVGLLAGVVLSLVQIMMVNPIIFEAETFEMPDTHSHGHHESGGHHSHEEWAPEDGSERTFYTIISNISAGIGFAAIILALMSQLQLFGVTRTNVFKGLLWGVAGFIAFFVAPGLGVPPEIPGIEAAPIEHRQLWWLLTVCCAGIGLLILAFASIKVKALGLFLLTAPYLVPIPHSHGPLFTHPNPDAVASLTSLHEQFVLYSGISNFIFWVVLGSISAWLLNRWILQGQSFHEQTA